MRDYVLQHKPYANNNRNSQRRIRRAVRFLLTNNTFHISKFKKAINILSCKNFFTLIDPPLIINRTSSSIYCPRTNFFFRFAYPPPRHYTIHFHIIRIHFHYSHQSGEPSFYRKNLQVGVAYPVLK